MPVGFKNFSSGCPGLPSLGFVFDDSGCNPAVTGFALFEECGHTCPEGLFAQVEYDGSTDNAGPAIRVDPDSIKTNATLLAAIYIPAQTTIALVRWDGQSLAEFDESMVINSVVITLSPGDVLLIESSLTDPEVYRVKVNGTTKITATIADEVLSVVNSCIGFVVVATVPTVTPPTGEEALIAVQTTDQSKTNNTLTNSTGLVLAMEANSTYVGVASLVFENASATPDLLIEWVTPAGATGQFVDVAWDYDVKELNTDYFYNIPAGFPLVVHFDFCVVNGVNAGDLQFQFAQFTTDASASILKANSFIMMFKQV